MISAETSALVAGGMRAPASTPTAPVTVLIQRGVMLGGQRVEPGTVLQVSPSMAAELISAGKATRTTTAATEPPVTAPTPSAKKPTKEQSHA